MLYVINENGYHYQFNIRFQRKNARRGSRKRCFQGVFSIGLPEHLE